MAKTKKQPLTIEALQGYLRREQEEKRKAQEERNRWKQKYETLKRKMEEVI